MVEIIVSPTGRSARVWMHFGFKKDSSGKIDKSKHAVCKLCNALVAHGGGTTNLRNHLRLNHSLEYLLLYPPEENSHSLTVDAIQSRIEDFVSVPKLLTSSMRAKMLTEAVADFISKDMRPVSVVDGQGFLNLMHVAEPRYTVPCRKTVMDLIDQKYHVLKERIGNQVAQQCVLSLTTDMWTSRAGDGYISLTAHYITDDSELSHQNLSMCHFPGTHDHSNIAEILQKLANTWHIDLGEQVSCFTTDNGSNIVKSLKDELNKMHIPCAGHTLNLSVEAGLKERTLSSAVARCRKIVTHFNQSRVDREMLSSKQELLGIPKHSLIKDVSTRWNSTHDMIKRLCEQQPAISAVLHRRRDLLHLEISPEEWRILEDITELLEPYKDVTTYLSAESYPTISALGPLFAAIQAKLTHSDNDSVAVRSVKSLLAADMSTRYQSTGVSLLLHKASFLDLRFKTLAHLSAAEKEETVDSIIQDLLTSIPVEEVSETDGEVVEVEEPEKEAVVECSTTPKKQKTTLLEKLLGRKFEGNQTTITVSENKIVQAEISYYKSASPIGLRDKPLKWWNVRKRVLPNLARLTQKYLGIVATSVPSERLFSTAGNIVSAKRAALLPENVEKLVFLHENLQFD